MQKIVALFLLTCFFSVSAMAQVPASCPASCPAACPGSCPAACPSELTPAQLDEINSQDLMELCQSIAVRVPPQICTQLKQQFGTADLRGCTRNFAQLLDGYSGVISQVCEGVAAAATNTFLSQYGTNCSEATAYFEATIEKMNTFPEVDVLLHCDEQDSTNSSCTVMNDCGADSGVCVQYSLHMEPQCKASDLCRNNVIDPGEECQGNDCGDHSCEEREMIGTIKCDPSCVLNWSGCSKPVSVQLEADASEDCIGETGILGITGSPPRVSFDYGWGNAGNRCIVREIHKPGVIYGVEETIENPDFVYCDTTQATMDMLTFTVRLANDVYPQIAENPTAFLESGTKIELPVNVYIALKSDFSPSLDFRRDFDYYQTSVNFADTPSYYTAFRDQDPNFLLDPTRLVFEPAEISEPGIYLVQSTIDITDIQNFKVIFKLSKVQDPNPDSILYYLPFEGAIGEQSPSGEPMSRQGYGIGLRGSDALVLNQRFSQMLKLNPIASTNENFSLVKHNSFQENNNDQRGKIMTIDLQSKTIEKTDSYPTPVLFEQGPREQPIFIIQNPDDSILHISSYSPWNILQTTASCDDVTLIGEDIPDEPKENFSCSNQPIDYAHTVVNPSKEDQTSFLGTIFYSPNDSLVLKGMCGTQFKSPAGNGETISLNGGASFSFQGLMDGIRNKQVCMKDDVENKQIVFFWNKRKLLSQLPACDGCICSNSIVAPMLTNSRVQQEQLYENQSQAFQATVDSPQLIDQSHLSLWVKAPNANWAESPRALRDDGGHFDQFSNDNIFGAIDASGFSVPGNYSYRIELSIEGQPLQAKTGDFQVFEPATCSPIQVPPEPSESRTNIFFLGQGYEFQEDIFTGAVNAQWTLFSGQIPEPMQNNIFVYAVASPGNLSCDFKHAQTMTAMEQTINIVDCHGNLPVAVTKCGAELGSDDSYIIIHNETPYVVRTPGSLIIYLLGLTGGEGENPFLISNGVSFSPAFTNMPLQFYATVTNPTEVNPETQLELWINSIKKNGSFYNDGLHFDGTASDGIFSFPYTGFPNPGNFQFDIHLNDSVGTLIDQQGSALEIIPANACHLVSGPGNQGFFVNFFLLKQGTQDSEQFYTTANTSWETLKQSPDLAPVANFINTFALPTTQNLECNLFSVQLGTPPSIACNSESVNAALEECREPLQMAPQEQDIVFVFIEGIPYQIRGFEGILNELGEERA
jgi:hypothetical protein